MTAKEPVGHAVDLIFLDDVRIIEVGIADGGSQADHKVAACPVAKADGHTVGVLLVEILQGLIQGFHTWAQLLLIGLIHHRNRIEGFLECPPVALHPRHGEARLLVGILRDQILSFCFQALCLGEGTLCQLIVIALQRPTGSLEHLNGIQILIRIARGKGPHIIGRATALAIGRHLVGLQRGIVMQTIGDRGGITQVMVVVEDGVGERLGHVTDLLGLSHKIERAMLDKLEDIGHAIRTMQFHIPLFLTDEGLVAHGLEQLPRPDQILHHTDIGTRLDIEVACVKEAADVQAWDEFKGLVFRFSGGTLTMQVEVVALRCLQIALLEGLTMPSAIALSDIHVIHVDRHPHIGGGIGNLVIDMGVDQEVVGLRVAILDVIHSRLSHTGEVELHIIIFIVGAPRLDIALKGFLDAAIILDAEE